MATTNGRQAENGGVAEYESNDREADIATNEETSLLGGHVQPDQGADNRRDAGKDSWVGYREYDGLPWYRVPSVYWLLGPYALFTLAFGGSLVPKLNLILDLVCNRYFTDRAALDPTFQFHRIILGGDNPQCQIPEVQQSVAVFMLWLSVIVGTLSAFTAPKLGSLSDRYGRKRIICICGLGGISSEIITILCARFPDVVHYRWFILGAVCDGLAGSFTAGSLLSHSYTSDCTPPSKRGVAIGYLHSCLFTGLAFGPLLAGYFVKWTGSLISIFYVVLGCHTVFILFIWFVLPESVSKRRQLGAREKFAKEREARDALPVAAWVASAASAMQSYPLGPEFARVLHSVQGTNPFAPLRILLPRGPDKARLRRNLIAFAAIDVCVLGAAMGAGTVILLYSELMFGWGNFETSRFVSFTSIVRVLVLAGVFPVVNYFFRTRPLARRRRESAAPLVETNAGADELDLWVLRVALLSDIVGITGYVFVRSPQLFVLCGATTAVGGLGSATIQAAITKHVPADRVGQLLGAVGLLHALSRVFAPMILNGLYAATVKTYPQAFFVLLVSLFVMSLGASFLLRPHVFLKESEPVNPAQTEDERQNNLNEEDALVDEEVVPGL